MRRPRLWIRILALATAVALVTTACDGRDGSATDPEAGGTPDVTVAPDLGPTGAPEEVFAEDARVLNVAIAEPSTLDPMRIQDPGSVLIARQLYEGLTAWDPAAEEAVPAAAESWQVANGGRTFRFRLHQGMTYHDGSPVRARDFVFAFNRIARRASASELAYTLERVRGFDDVNVTGSSNNLQGLRAPDDNTLIIDLSEPFQDLPAVLTHPGLVPLPRRAVQNVDAFLRRPTGNGPFQMAGPWTPGDPVVLTRFAGFIRTPPLDGIRFVPFPDAAASWLRFVDGEFDIAEVPVGQTEAAAQEYGDRGFQPFLAGYYFGLNVSAGALRNVRLRRAISRAIDRETISSSIYRGTLRPARGIVPHGMPGFHENVCLPVCTYDRDAARRLVRRVPRRQRTVQIDFTAGQPHRQVVRAVRENLEDVGLRVRTRSFPMGRYLRRLGEGRQQMYRLGWIAEYPVPDVFLGDLFASDSPDNHSRFGSGRVDRLLERARSESSDGARHQLYLRAEKEILEHLPVIPIGSFMTHWVAHERVQGIEFDVMGGFDAADITLVAEEEDGDA